MTIPIFNSTSKKNNFCFLNLSVDYLDDMFEYSTKKGFYDFFESDPPKTKQEMNFYLLELIKRNSEGYLSGEASVWFIYDKLKGKVIGSAGYVGIDSNRGNATMTFGLSMDYWGSSLAFDMLYSLVHHGFNVMKLNRMSSITFSNNVRLINFIEIIGFKQEGLIRNYYKIKNGQLVNATIHGILAAEVSYERCLNLSKILSNRLSHEH